MKVKKIYIIQGIFLLIIILISYHYLNNYFNPPIKYPFSSGAEVELLPEASIIQEVEYPIEMKVTMDYYQDDTDENIVIGDYNIEFVINDKRDAILSSVQLFRSDSLISYDIKLNNAPLELTQKNGSYCFPIISLDMKDRSVTRNCTESMYYVLPPMPLKGDQKVNKFEAHYKLNRNLKQDSGLEIPYFFNKDHYSKTIWLETGIGSFLVSPYHNFVEANTKFKLSQNHDYHILINDSGWMGRYMEKVSNIGVTASVPLTNQTSKFLNEIMSNKIDISKQNAPEGFRILLIPSLQIFLLPLIFLWVPIIYVWIFPKQGIFKSISIIYPITILGLIGVSSLNDISKFSKIFSDMFYFFNSAFVYITVIFPILYIVVIKYFSTLDVETKDRFT
jgi:hypothetical protein